MVASGGLLAPGAPGAAPVMLPISVQPKVRLTPAGATVTSACSTAGHGSNPVSASNSTAIVVAGGGGKRRDSGDSESRSHYSSSNGSSDEHASNKIFVGGISFQTTADKLRSYFAPYGTILDVMVLKDPNTNRNRGFGFVTFADVESVHKVLAQDDHSLDGKKIDPKLATPKGQKATTGVGVLPGGGMLLAGYGGDMMGMPRKVFVGGVSQETGAQELLDYFTQFGPVLECNLQMDNNTKRHRGFAFVTFEHEEHSARVVRKHHHVVKNKTVECKYAQPKETIQASERAKRAHLLTMMQTAAVTNPLAAAVAASHAQQVQQHYSRVLSAAGPAGAGSAVGPGCGPAFSGLASFRYAPYTVPAMTAATAAAVAAAAANSQLAAGATPVTSAGPAAAPLGHLAALPAGLSALQATTAPGAPGAPTGSLTAPAAAAPYQLANFDISGLQGLEWGGAPIYGMYTA